MVESENNHVYEEIQRPWSQKFSLCFDSSSVVIDNYFAIRLMKKEEDRMIFIICDSKTKVRREKANKTTSNREVKAGFTPVGISFRNKTFPIYIGSNETFDYKLSKLDGWQSGFFRFIIESTSPITLLELPAGRKPKEYLEKSQRPHPN